MQWITLTFKQLSTWQLYDLLQLRINVFVVEQHCPYPELDGRDQDPQTLHLLGYKNDKLVAYARLLPAGLAYPEVSIGRVVTHIETRGEGYGHALIQQAFIQIKKKWQDAPITIGAQYRLLDFYLSHGFKAISEPYLEDGISHIYMQKK